MSILDRIWDGMQTVIKMNDKVDQMRSTITKQQTKIEDLTERVIRLETIIYLQSGRLAPPSPPAPPALGNDNG